VDADAPRVVVAVADRLTTADEVPVLRRQLAEWCADRGVAYYRQMIMLGRQPVRPAGPPAAAAASLAAEETRRLHVADLWHLDAELCELLAHAQHGMPRFAPTEQDLPSRAGFAVFATPIDVRSPRDETGLAEFVEALDRGDQARTIANSQLMEIPVEIGAVSWGPLPGLYHDTKTPAGGVWMTFYAYSRLDDAIVDPETLRMAKAGMPPMLIDNEAVVPWCPPGADPARYTLPAAGDTNTTWGWASLVFAAFRLATQAGLADTREERTARPERRRTQRAGLPERDVHTVRLRHSDRDGSHGQAGGGREYRHRWVVRGHWRNQPWGPGRSLRRPVWVLPHVKGPDGAPLLGAERVNVAAAPAGHATTAGGDL
jgi:hypothetical protein